MTIAAEPSTAASTDWELLRDHLAGSPDAFNDLVHRHIDMVYSAALRQVRDAHIADDVTQATFLVLWQKAYALTENVILPGWLYRTTRNCANNAIRLRTIRERHERRAAEMVTHSTAPSDENQNDDTELSAVLDQAVSELPAIDRNAVVMHYFHGKSVIEVAADLKVTPEAARKRIERALDKMRLILARLGVTTTTPTLSAVLLRNAIVHAPPHVATSVAATIASASAGTTTGAAGLIAKGAFVAMSAKSPWVIAAAVLLLLLGTGSAILATRPRSTTVTVSQTTNALRIQAYIDGRSRLIVHGNTMHWSNFEYNPPGVFGTTHRPTTINGRSWTPTWSDLPFSTMSLSDSFDKVDPPLPSAAVKVKVNPVEVRGQVRIIQQPTIANDCTLIVEFDDSGPPGYARYIVDITFDS